MGQGLMGEESLTWVCREYETVPSVCKVGTRITEELSSPFPPWLPEKLVNPVVQRGFCETGILWKILELGRG